MKVFFLKDDSLYKIFKTLQKIPKSKEVDVYIEGQSPFFDHPWRGKQVKELIDNEGIRVKFVTKSETSKNYYHTMGLPYRMIKKKKRTKLLQMIYFFFFNIKKFHLYAYNKKNYTFYIVFIFETLIVLFIAYLLYGLVIPSTIVRISPMYEVENIVYNFRFYPTDDKEFPLYTNQISIPYFTGKLTLRHQASLSLEDVLYDQTVAKGTVRLVNTTNNKIPLLSDTQLVTDDGLIYRTTQFVEIPAKSSDSAGFINVPVVAALRDIQNNIIGEKGNISRGSRMYIRRLLQSYYRKEIYAEVVDDFVGGETLLKDEVGSGDIQKLNQNLSQYIENNKNQLIRESMQDRSLILLPFIVPSIVDDNYFSYTIPQGENVLSGSIAKDVVYAYVKRDDILAGFQRYVDDRSTNLTNLVGMRGDAITFLKDTKTDQNNVYIVSTQIPLIRGYNFIADPNGIQAEILERIIGVSDIEAKRIINSYSQISDVQIVIKPPRYNTVSKLKSRIYFRVSD